MYRSGTSVVVQMLEVLNILLGDNLMPGAPKDNPFDFFEDLDVHDINNRLLEKVNQSWSSGSAPDFRKINKKTALNIKKILTIY